MFEERLSGIRDRIDGALAVSLVAFDGIPVETQGDAGELDLEAVAAEMLSQVQAISDDHQDLPLGRVRQFSVATDRYTLMLGALTESYYLMVVLDESGSVGRARFELRRAPLAFAEDLI